MCPFKITFLSNVLAILVVCNTDILKMIIHGIFIISALIFWRHIACQNDFVGIPLLPYLHLAKAKAMHSLAVEKAKFHHHPHLLLKANPEYHEDSNIPIGVVIPNPNRNDKLMHSSSPYSDNSNFAPHYSLKDARKYYAQQNQNPVEASASLRFKNEFNETSLYQDNVVATPIKDSNAQVENLLNTDQPDSELFKTDKEDEDLYTFTSITLNKNDTQTPTNEDHVSGDDEFFDNDSEEFVDDNKDQLEHVKVKNSTRNFLRTNIQQVDFLKKSVDNTETYLISDPRIGNSQKDNETSHTSSTLEPDDNVIFTTTAPLNIFTQTPDLNEEAVKPSKPISENDNLKTITGKNSNSHVNTNTNAEDKLTDDQFDKVLNDDLDMLSLLASTHVENNSSNTEQPGSFLQNFDTLQNYTKMPLDVFLPEEHQSNPNQDEANPIVQNDLIQKNKYLDYQKPSSSFVDMQSSKLIPTSRQYPEEFNDQHSIYPTPVIPLVNQDKPLPRSEMRVHQSPRNLQPNTNYEIYSRNRNFNNKFRDEQLYLWNLNNMKNNENILQSPLSSSVIENPASPLKQFHEKSKSHATILNSFRPNLHQLSNHNTFNRLLQYIGNFQETRAKHSQINSKPYQFDPRESEASNQPTQSHPELVSSYLIRIPPNQAYFGERYRREIKGLTKTKLVDKERRAQLPLISLILDPYARLDVPKTIKNFGTVTRKSLEDKKAPVHHFSNLLASVKDAALAALKIPPQDLLIPSKYNIINKNALGNEIVGSPKFAGESDKILSSNSLIKDDVTKVFHKVGSMLRQSVESGQQALQHVTDVGHNARKIISSSRKSFPNLLIPYIKAPEVIKTAKGKKLTMIAPRFADVGEETPNSHEHDYVKVGNVLEALSLSHPEEEGVGTMEITIEPKSKEPKLQSRFGETDKPEDAGYYVVNNHLKGNALNPEEVHEVIDIFHTVKEIAGAKSLKNFLRNVKIQLINCTQNVTMDDDDDETVGNYWKFTRAMVEPFMGIFQNTDKTLKQNKQKHRRATPKPNFYDVEQANFLNFLAGYELVSAINPEMYRVYFHEPLQIDHTKDVNLQEIQHEIQNANLLVVPPLLKSTTRGEIAPFNEEDQTKDDEENNE